MPSKTRFLILLMVFFFRVSHCNGDTCYCTCCAGNFCTPTFQGTIAVPSCASSSCESLCQREYPRECTNGPGSANYQCKGGSFAVPNWVGVFKVGNRCDTRTCCCPVGDMILSRVGMNSLRVQMLFTGQGCPGATSLDDTIAMPNDFNVQIAFLGNNILVTLSQDSRTIQMNNPVFPSCSETAARDETSSTSTINLASVFILISLMILRHFVI